MSCSVILGSPGMLVQEFVHQEFMTRYTLEGLYDWNIPTFPKGGVPVDDVQSHIEGFVLFGSFFFCSQGFFLLYAGMLSTSFIKNPVTAGDVTQSVYNLWRQIYLSSCFHCWEFEWIWYHFDDMYWLKAQLDVCVKVCFVFFVVGVW